MDSNVQNTSISASVGVCFTKKQIDKQRKRAERDAEKRLRDSGNVEALGLI